MVYGLNAASAQAFAAGNEELRQAVPWMLATWVETGPGIRLIWERVRERLTSQGRSRFAESVDAALDTLERQEEARQG